MARPDFKCINRNPIAVGTLAVVLIMLSSVDTLFQGQITDVKQSWQAEQRRNLLIFKEI